MKTEVTPEHLIYVRALCMREAELAVSFHPMINSVLPRRVRQGPATSGRLPLYLCHTYAHDMAPGISNILTFWLRKDADDLAELTPEQRPRSWEQRNRLRAVAPELPSHKAKYL